jgi:hypothetical protein
MEREYKNKNIWLNYNIFKWNLNDNNREEIDFVFLNIFNSLICNIFYLDTWL